MIRDEVYFCVVFWGGGVCFGLLLLVGWLLLFVCGCVFSCFVFFSPLITHNTNKY